MPLCHGLQNTKYVDFMFNVDINWEMIPALFTFFIICSVSASSGGPPGVIERDEGPEDYSDLELADYEDLPPHFLELERSCETICADKD